MITNFTTASLMPSAKGGSNALIYLLLGGTVAYFGYKYIVKPELDKRKLEQEK